MASADLPAAAEIAFDKHEIVTGEASHQTVLTGFLLPGDMANLTVIYSDPNDDPRLHPYALEGDTWERQLDEPLRPEVLFVDVATIAGRDRLVTYEHGRLSWFDPESAVEQTLVSVRTSFRSPTDGGVPHVDITRDLNHDGRDDLILPDVDGFWISTQSSDGSFSDTVKLGPAEPFATSSIGNLDVDEPADDPSRTYSDLGITAMTVPVYLSRVHEMDYDLDGRSDLVFWNSDRFDVHLQDERGQFDPHAQTFATEVSFDSEGAYSRAFEYHDAGVFSTVFGIGKKTQRKVLHSLRDLNGDGVADLVTLTLAGRSITRQRSLYEVHLGIPTPTGTEFASDASASIRPRGRAGGMQPWGYASQKFDDLDGDGQAELMFLDVSVGLGGMMRALVGNSVPIDLEFYRIADDTYPTKPTTRRKIRRFDPLDGLGNVFFPTVLMGDVDGDGRSDLLVGKSPQELQVFLGVPGPDLLAQQPQKVAIALPYNERNTRLVDLNQDGKQDLLMHHTPTSQAPKEPSRVSMLIPR